MSQRREERGDRDARTAKPPARRPDRRVSQDRKVIIRDLAIFHIKLLLDGLKDIVLSPLSVLAAALDLVSPTQKRGQRLYAVLLLGERFDRWLNLFNSSERAGSHAEGLFGASRAGANDLLGKLEELVIGHAEEEEEDVEQDRSAVEDDGEQIQEEEQRHDRR